MVGGRSRKEQREKGVERHRRMESSIRVTVRFDPRLGAENTCRITYGGEG